MNTYLVLSSTNYGETVTVINADNEQEAREFADASPSVWDRYELIEVPKEKGIVGTYGGD